KPVSLVQKNVVGRRRRTPHCCEPERILSIAGPHCRNELFSVAERLTARSQFVVRATRENCTAKNASIFEGISNDETKSQGDFITCWCCRTADGSPGAYSKSGPLVSGE